MTQPHSMDELCRVLREHDVDYTRWDDGAQDELWLDVGRGARLSVDNGRLCKHITSIDVRVVFSESPRAKRRLKLYGGKATPHNDIDGFSLMHSLRTRILPDETGDQGARRLVRATLQLELSDAQIRPIGGVSDYGGRGGSDGLPTVRHMWQYEARLTDKQYQDFYVSQPVHGETFLCFFWLHEIQCHDASIK